MPSFHLIFADWRSRPGRQVHEHDETCLYPDEPCGCWRRSRRNNFPTEDMWRREYPETLEDVLLAAEEGPFPGWAIRQCVEDYEYPSVPIVGRPAHRYIKMWDQGRTHDAFVGVVLDVTRAPYYIVDYSRLVNRPYPVAQAEVERIHHRYPGPTYVGDDNASKAIVENLTIPATHFLMGSLKPRCIMALKVALEEGYLRIPGRLTADNAIVSAIPQLVFELQGYLWEDKGLVQDSVMALANCLYEAGPPIHNFERPTVRETEGRTTALRPRGAVRAPSRVAGLSSSVASRRAAAGRNGNGRQADEWLR